MSMCPVCGDHGYSVFRGDCENAEPPEGYCNNCGFSWQFPANEEEAAGEYVNEIIPNCIEEWERMLPIFKRIRAEAIAEEARDAREERES